MADFSDREDMQLVQLAHRSVVKTGRVDWNDVAFKDESPTLKWGPSAEHSCERTNNANK